MEAVKQDGYTLKYVKEQTPELCMEAVKQDGYALYYVKVQTPELCMEAVKKDGGALRYVKEQTPEICKEAVKQNANALEYVKDKDCLKKYMKDLKKEKTTNSKQKVIDYLVYLHQKNIDLLTSTIIERDDEINILKNSIKKQQDIKNQEEQVNKNSPEYFLEKAKFILKERRLKYGDNYKVNGKLLNILFGHVDEQLTDKEEEILFTKEYLFIQIVNKLTRYCNNIKHGDQDSLIDLINYCAILSSVDADLNNI